MSSDRGQAIRILFLHDILGEEFRESTAFCTIFQRFEVLACDCEIVGRRHRHAIISNSGWVVFSSLANLPCGRVPRSEISGSRRGKQPPFSTTELPPGAG